MSSKAPFGTVLGLSLGGVPCYSCHYRTAGPGSDGTMVVDGTFTGYKWQCVEFARRWGLVQRGYVFESIPMAYHIFDLTHVKMVATGKKLPMAAVKNGSRERPEPGSLLIWNHGGEHGFTGHVAVICEALDTGVRIAEQNYKDRAWAPSQNYGRELPVEIDERGNYWIRNKGVLGWMTVRMGGAGGGGGGPERGPERALGRAGGGRRGAEAAEEEEDGGDASSSSSDVEIIGSTLPAKKTRVDECKVS